MLVVARLNNVVNNWTHWSINSSKMALYEKGRIWGIFLRETHGIYGYEGGLGCKPISYIGTNNHKDNIARHAVLRLSPYPIWLYEWTPRWLIMLSLLIFGLRKNLSSGNLLCQFIFHILLEKGDKIYHHISLSTEKWINKTSY